MSNMTRMAAVNGFAATVGRVVGIFVSIVLTPIVLRGIGRELYGVLTIAGSLYDYLALFRGGLGTAMRRHVTINVHRKDIPAANRYYGAGFWWGGVLRLPILVAALLLSGPVCDFVQIPMDLRDEAVLGVRLILIAAWIGDFTAMFEVPIFASGRTSAIFYMRSSFGLLRLAVMATAFTLFVPTLRLYGSLLIGLTITLTVGMAVLAQRAGTVRAAVPRVSFGDSTQRRELFSYGGLALIGQIGELLWVASDNLLIGRFFGTGEVALYSFGARWMPLLRSSGMSILRSIQPLFTRLEAEKTDERSRRATHRSVALSAGVSVPACLVPCVLGDIFIANWVGSEYVEAYPVMLITLIPLSLDLALYPVWVVLSARGRIAWVSGGELGLAAAKIILALVLAVGFKQGILGFAWANGIALLARNVVIRPFAMRNLDALPPVTQLLRLYANALAGATPGLVLLYFTRPLYDSSLLTVVVAAAAGGAITMFGALWASMGRTGIGMLRRGLRAPRDNERPTDENRPGGEQS